MAVPAEVLPVHKHRLLGELVDGLDARSLSWVSGYMAGLAAQGSRAAAHAAVLPAAPAGQGTTVTVLFGTQTGNARRWAEQIAGQSREAGLAVNLMSIGEYKPRSLKSESHLLVIISTQGDGEPPDDALDFMEFVMSKRAPKLETLKYAVLALGDSSYPDFCVTGRRLDERLAELGAHRIADRADCDLDIETVAEPWWQTALEKLRESVPEQAPVQHVASVTPLRRETVFGRDNPFAAEVLQSQRITGRGTAREVRHLELSLEGSGLHYEPGDCLGVWPRNPQATVDAMLEALSADGDESVTRKGEERPLREWLTKHCEITQIAKPLLVAHAQRSGDGALKQLLEPDNRAHLARFLETHQPIDLLRNWQADWEAAEWVDVLRPLTPRLYSIASSPTLGDEAHLTVAWVAYERFGASHLGAASTYLRESDEGASVPVYVEENPRFRLPQDASRDVIMIGAGTGVAPFRAFVQERAESGASGRNWLFFGAQHFHSQFLYQVEWQQALRDGSLARLDLAFSRDQQERVYVQHRLAERGGDIYDWIQGGAHVYVCGGIAMEKDVSGALQRIAASELGGDEAAGEWFSDLKRGGRYCRDVY